MTRIAEAALPLIATAALATGCLYGDDWDSNRVPQSREEALRAADDAYEIAVRQDVDFRPISCIYGNGNWTVVVVFEGQNIDRADRNCGYGRGYRRLVALDPEGNVIAVR